MIFLVYGIAFASLFYYVFVLSPARSPVRDIFPSFMARYSPFVLKAPLNPKQANKPWECREILLCPGLKW